MRYALFLTFLLSAPGLQAQSRREEFLNVRSWRGSFDMSANSQSESNGYKLTFQGTASGQLVHDTPDLASTRWLGKIQGSTVNIRAVLTWATGTMGQCSVTEIFVFSGPIDPGTSSSETQLRVFLNVWDMRLSRTHSTGGTRTKTTVCPDSTRTDVYKWTANIPTMSSLSFPYPPQGLSLEGSGKAFATGILNTPIPSQQVMEWDVHFRLEPAVDDLLLEVTSTQYDAWRPTAEPGPKAGGPIQFTATVKRASGETAQVKLSRFVWELVDTSREPGIALNSPFLNPYDGEPDLKLEPQPGQFVTGADHQKIERPAPASAQDSAVVLPYDWGAWSTLQVTAFLPDGGKLVGKLKGSQEDGVRLPKRAKDSFIAEGWKKETGVSGADLDDNEKEPEGEPGCDGDGLTLYEEYRGFYENGKHMEGKPKRKDLFIFNGCGAVAEPGISLFGSLTDLELHRDLLEDERNSFDGDYTAINGNFAKGPHRVLQHRVEVTVCGTTRDRGAGTRTNDPNYSNYHLRPKDVENIFVERPDARFWKQQYGVSSEDQPRQFDVALAHELFHAVGVEHHGEGDRTRKFEAHDASYEDNPTGHATWLMFGETPVTFLDETTGADITESTASRAIRLLNGIGRGGITAADISDRDWYVQNYQIGVENGQGSGDENCVMRYWFSDLYPKKGAENTWYMVPPGTEPVGSQICSSTTGKTINVADRSPQPRYFDAASTRGNCKFWVCVNDAIPGKSSSIPEKIQ